MLREVNMLGMDTFCEARKLSTTICSMNVKEEILFTEPTGNSLVREVPTSSLMCLPYEPGRRQES